MHFARLTSMILLMGKGKVSYTLLRIPSISLWHTLVVSVDNERLETTRVEISNKVRRTSVWGVHQGHLFFFCNNVQGGHWDTE